MIGNVIVGYDGHDPAHDALALGAALVRRGGELIAACMCEQEQPWTPFERTHQLLRRERLGALRAEVEARQPELAARDGIDTIAVPAHTAAEGLRDLAADYGSNVVVVGSTHRGPLGRVLPGTTASQLLDQAGCAVAVAPRGFALRPRRMETIGVGIDESQASRNALEAARALALALGARVVALAATGGRGGSPRTQPKADGEGPPVERLALVGSPAAALTRAAADLDLLVLGTHARGAAGRLLNTSVSHTLLSRSPTAVVVVPERMETGVTAPTSAETGAEGG
jgi:nucleotide-binding universal stress UspA family protein